MKLNQLVVKIEITVTSCHATAYIFSLLSQGPSSVTASATDRCSLGNEMTISGQREQRVVQHVMKEVDKVVYLYQQQ